MKVCNRCGETKGLDAFRPRGKTGRQTWCIVCHNRYIAQKAEARRVVLRDLKSVPCRDCGVRYPFYVMDFDHVHGTKRFNLASSWSLHAPEKAFWAEIKKCEVVCSNCHRLRTHRNGQFNPE